MSLTTTKLYDFQCCPGPGWQVLLLRPCQHPEDRRARVVRQRRVQPDALQENAILEASQGQHLEALLDCVRKVLAQTSGLVGHACVELLRHFVGHAGQARRLATRRQAYTPAQLPTLTVCLWDLAEVLQ